MYKHKRFTLAEVKELVYQEFEAVTPEQWQSLIKHVQDKVEEADGLNEELTVMMLLLMNHPP